MPYDEWSAQINHMGDLGEVVRARKPKRLPVVLTREEVKAVLAQLSGDKMSYVPTLFRHTFIRERI